jgi:DNA-directed RNA polymerase specialized sigma24 family protein
VTCNVALRAIRRRKLERRIFDHSADVEVSALSQVAPENPERQVIARRHLERFHGHLARLSVKLSEALILHDVLGFGLNETASLTGTTHAAVRSRLVRGRHQLAQRLRLDAEWLSRDSG